MFLILGAQKQFTSRIFFNHPPIKVWKKSQPLVQYVKNDNSKRRNMCESNDVWGQKCGFLTLNFHLKLYELPYKCVKIGGS
jgi:hypothetical protein